MASICTPFQHESTPSGMGLTASTPHPGGHVQPDLFDPDALASSEGVHRELPRGFEYLASWTEAELTGRLSALTDRASERRRELDAKDSVMLLAMGGAGIHYMTDGERQEMHAIKLALPTFGEQAVAAKARIAARLAARKAARRALEVGDGHRQ